jgi:hypothetical protein
MRYLNKIVFINSTDKSLPYAEVSLDGNVHFIEMVTINTK